MTDFVEFPKISRLFRDIVVTEKLDGTNAQVMIEPITSWNGIPENSLARYILNEAGEQIQVRILAGSRTRWITPQDDNFGFARWVEENADELVKLGVGNHFGEWWGKGIQRNYGLQERRFSLFNTSRWDDENVRPKCCHVVPTLHTGPMNTHDILFMAQDLEKYGSQAAPGFMNPEGLVVFHAHSNSLFKYTLKNDEPKGKRP